MDLEKVDRVAQKMKETKLKMCKAAATMDTVFKTRIAEITCEMLCKGESVTLDSLIAECVRRHDILGRQDNHELDIDWHTLGAAIEHLHSLRKESRKKTGLTKVLPDREDC